MGKQVRRVPIGFDWPIGKTWWGYELPEIPCRTCRSTGKMINPIIEGTMKNGGTWHTIQSGFCPTCKGKGLIHPVIEIPSGPGYQMWDTTFNWRPISPVFDSPDGLAHYLTDNKEFAYAISSLNYEKWLEFILDTNDGLSILINCDDVESYCQV